MYINDLPSAFKFETTLLADDTSLCLADKNFSKLQSGVNIELQKFGNWLRKKELSLNHYETNFMIINIPAKHLSIISV